jgi:hypothetical protein
MKKLLQLAKLGFWAMIEDPMKDDPSRGNLDRFNRDFMRTLG